MISNITTQNASLNTQFSPATGAAETNKPLASEKSMTAEQAKQLASQISQVEPSRLLNAVSIEKLQSNQTFSLMA